MNRCGSWVRARAEYVGYALMFMLLPSKLWATADAPFGAVNKATEILIGLARPVAVVMIVVAGIMWAVSRQEEGLKKVANAVIGISIAIFAVSLAGTLGIGGAIF